MCVLKTGECYHIASQDMDPTRQPAACGAFLSRIREGKLAVMRGHSRVITLGDVDVWRID